MAALQEGEPEKAEGFLAWLSEQEHPLAERAGFHSGQLAECRVDLQTALDRYRRACGAGTGECFVSSGCRKNGAQSVSL
jgi:hypothetical protein